MAFSYLHKLFLESEMCEDWALLHGFWRLAYKIQSIARKQLNTAILDVCKPEPLAKFIETKMAENKSRPIKFMRYERIQ